jgi:DNA-binding NtrC family response regulator
MGRKRLLVVDDEPDLLDFVERVFRADYDVARAQNGEEALQILRKERVDVLITDQRMPRMTGLQLLEYVANEFPRVIKVLVSGYADVPDIQHAISRCKIHSCVVKPVDAEKLREVVRAAFERVESSDWTLSAGTPARGVKANDP